MKIEVIETHSNGKVERIHWFENGTYVEMTKDELHTEGGFNTDFNVLKELHDKYFSEEQSQDSWNIPQSPAPEGCDPY